MIDISVRENINIHDKKVTVIGLGLSGVEAAKLANHLGARVFASDSGSSKLKAQGLRQCFNCGFSSCICSKGLSYSRTKDAACVNDVASSIIQKVLTGGKYHSECSLSI